VQGRPGCLGQTCGDCRLRFLFAGGPWARPAPGLPCALFDIEGDVLARPGRFSAAGRHISCLKFESEIAGPSLRSARSGEKLKLATRRVK
jgi:hypothetical protein